jgi:uncharacterized protein (TIGR02246 family)
MLGTIARATQNDRASHTSSRIRSHRGQPTMHALARLLAATPLVLLQAACQSLPAPDSARSEVAAATRQWADAYNRCDASAAAARYDSDAVLWGTVSPAINATPDGIRQYFERGCAGTPKPTVALGESIVRVYGDTATDSGTYVFTVFPGGRALISPARYSFTYRRKGSDWLIVAHHSSLMPAPPAAPPAGSK